MSIFGESISNGMYVPLGITRNLSNVSTVTSAIDKLDQECYHAGTPLVASTKLAAAIDEVAEALDAINSRVEFIEDGPNFNGVDSSEVVLSAPVGIISDNQQSLNVNHETRVTALELNDETQDAAISGLVSDVQALDALSSTHTSQIAGLVQDVSDISISVSTIHLDDVKTDGVITIAGTEYQNNTPLDSILTSLGNQLNTINNTVIPDLQGDVGYHEDQINGATGIIFKNNQQDQRLDDIDTNFNTLNDQVNGDGEGGGLAGDVITIQGDITDIQTGVTDLTGRVETLEGAAEAPQLLGFTGLRLEEFNDEDAETRIQENINKILYTSTIMTNTGLGSYGGGYVVPSAVVEGAELPAEFDRVNICISKLAQRSFNHGTELVAINNALIDTNMFNFRQLYSSSNTYTYLDVVYHDALSDGRFMTYIYINTSEDSNVFPDNTSYWEILTGFTANVIKFLNLGGSSPNGSDMAINDIYIDNSQPYYPVWVKTDGSTVTNIGSLLGTPGSNGSDGAIGATGSPGISYIINWRGEWNGGTYYYIGDGVNYNGSSFYCIADNSSNTPNTGGGWPWNVLALQGASGSNGADGSNYYYYSTTPGGSSGDIQYNGGSSFSGTSSMNFNGTNLIMSSGAGIQTSNFSMNGLTPSGTVSTSSNSGSVSGSDYASEYTIINQMRDELTALKEILKNNFGMINY